MPTGSTSGDLIRSSLRLLGVIATGETPSAAMTTDGLSTLNDLLETMSLSNLTVWGSDVASYTCTSGVGSYTIGATAIAPNFVGPRPVAIAGAYVRYQGVDFPLLMIGQSDYDAIQIKSQIGDIPQWMTYINDFPLGIIKLWPAPSSAVVLYLSDDRVLTVLTGLTTAINYPPGYYSYMRHALAVMLASEYGITASPVIVEIALSTLAAIKRTNGTKAIAQFDSAITGPNTYIWQSGT